MSETSRFWDGTATGDASASPYDAATEFAQVMMALSGADEYVNKGGVWLGQQGGLSVINTAANTVRVLTGNALVYGTWYSSDANTDITITTPSVSSRQDRIVLRKSWSSQTIRITKIVGTEGAGAPAITQSAGVTWDMPLAQVTITTGGAITILDNREFLGQSIPAKTNLLTNPGFEIWQRGTGAFTANGWTADMWTMLKGGTSTLSVSASTSDVATGSKYSLIATYTHNTFTQIYQKVEDHLQLRGRMVTFTCRVKTSTANAVRLGLLDSITTFESSYHTGSGDWETLTVSGVVGLTATYLQASLRLYATCSAVFDNATLVIGSAPNVYAPLHPWKDLAQCQRYYEIYSNSGDYAFDFTFGGYASAASQNMYLPIFFKQTKPGGSTPTVTKNGTWFVVNCGQPTIASTGRNGCTFTITSSGAGSMYAQNFNAGNSITIEANP